MDPFIPLSVALMGLLAMNLRALKAFDELVETIWEHHRELWVEQGRPIGTFWRPEDPDVKLISSLAARRRLRSGLMRTTPEWLPEDSPAHLKIATYRVTTVIGWGGLALVGLGITVWGAFFA
jgi:hypothetical protein